MDHILQFAISIDDEAIKSRVMKSAEEQIIKNLTESMAKELFGVDWLGRPNKGNVSDWVHDKVGEFLTAHKEEIIRQTVERLAEKLKGSKAMKEAAAGAVKAAE